MNDIHTTSQIASSYLKSSGDKYGWRSWIFSTDHKRIGILYLTAIFSFFGIAVCLGLLMRLELLLPGQTIISPDIYNSVFTLHGVIMVFLFVIPGIPASLGNFILPLILGARDVSFPRINLLSWWLFMLGALLAVVSIFIGGAPDTGWTFYVPYSVTSDTNVSLAVFGAFLIGFSSILTGINFITTIHRLRAPGMGWFQMPLFVWALYATAWIQVLATPVIGITFVLVILERLLNVGFFDPLLGGDPVLYQHLFWIYSHPAVYVMILPAMGVISEILPVFARKHIFGYKAIAFSSLAIAFVGYLVWGHHMYTSGISDAAKIFFSILTYLVAIPTGIKVFNWVATLYKGSIEVRVPMLYALGFIFLFLIGGLTGMAIASLSTDIHLHDTYYIVGHFHYTMFGGGAMGLFAGLHYWWPKLWGRMYSEKLAKVGWVHIMIGFNILYFPMLIMGIQGMPRRYFDYLPEFQLGQTISTVGSWILVAGLGIMIFNLLVSIRKGSISDSNPWKSRTLEWQCASPPTAHNFEEIPHGDFDPYGYGNENNE